MWYKVFFYLYRPCKKILLFFLLLIPACLYAQVDTAILTDTLPPEIVNDATYEDPPPEEVTTTDYQSDYFLNRSGNPPDSSIVWRQVPDSLVKTMQDDDDFWYANAVIEKEKEEEEKRSTYIPLGQQQWFQVLMWLVIIGGFAAAIMWYLAGSNVGLFRRKNKEISSAGDEELSTADIFAINYQKEIDKAEAAGNYRLAIRLMFLRLLKDMAGKNIIQYKQDRTNLDYLLQLQPTIYYNPFFRITRSYEYSWYGEFEVGESAYRIIRNDFKQMDQQLQ